MWVEHIKEILQGCDQYVVQVILGVLIIEQENISMQRPHVKEPIENLIEGIAKESLKGEDAD